MNPNNVKVIIMCGGRGKRMGKLTNDVPKPLIKINDHPILEQKIIRYIKQGFREFVLCIGYKGESIKQFIKTLNFPDDVKISFSDSGLQAGILKRVYDSIDKFENTAIVTYGDTITELNLNDLINQHNLSENEATIVIGPIQNPFGLVEYNSEDKVTYFKEKPTLNYYIGYAAIRKTALGLVSKKIINMKNGDGIVTFFKILMTLEKLGAYYYSGLQTTFNTEDELVNAQSEITNFYTAKESK